eukprot:COSAG04_NODE_6357_length_1348_cov_4.805114_1_plen_20_part_10
MMLPLVAALAPAVAAAAAPK